MGAKKKSAETDVQTPQMSVEEIFDRLDQLVTKMEEEDITLEESFASYEEGIRLLKSCNEQIAGVEKKVLQMTEDGTLVDYD